MAASLQARRPLFLFPRVHRSSQPDPGGRGFGVVVAAFGCFHWAFSTAVWLIVEGDFLNGVAHIFHSPRGLLRNRMTALLALPPSFPPALLSTQRDGGHSQTPKYVLTAVRRFGVSVSAAKHRRHSMRRCSPATSKTRSAAAGAAGCYGGVGGGDLSSTLSSGNTTKKPRRNAAVPMKIQPPYSILMSV